MLTVMSSVGSVELCELYEILQKSVKIYSVEFVSTDILLTAL